MVGRVADVIGRNPYFIGAYCVADHYNRGSRVHKNQNPMQQSLLHQEQPHGRSVVYTAPRRNKLNRP
jgi:hypothetical protein